MTGPEHYRAAEELLFGRYATAPGGALGTRALDIAAAQAHATLALAAATVEAGGLFNNDLVVTAWERAVRGE